MRIKDLFEEKRTLLFESFDSYLGENFFHVGGNFSRFSLSAIGSGEGNHILGHGIYFINDEKISLRYAKYVKTGSPQFYMVKFQNLRGEDIYNYRNKMPFMQRLLCDDIARELGFPDEKSMQYNHSTMKYGKGLPGAVFAKLGTKKGAELLIKHGIYGQYEDVGDGIVEISVWDTSKIRIIKKMSVKDYIDEHGESY